jgi:hypothetical protein
MKTEGIIYSREGKQFHMHQKTQKRVCAALSSERCKNKPENSLRDWK